MLGIIPTRLSSDESRSLEVARRYNYVASVEFNNNSIKHSATIVSPASAPSRRTRREHGRALLGKRRSNLGRLSVATKKALLASPGRLAPHQTARND
jgi:hypothetical protein